MKWTFYFDPAEVATLVKRSLAARGYVATSEQAMDKSLRSDGLNPIASSLPHQPHWTDVDKAKLEPGLILAVDRGVYLASNDKNQGWENGADQVSFADGINPELQSFDEWNDIVEHISPQGEREIFIHADQFHDAISVATRKHWLEVDYDDESDEILFGERPNVIVRVCPRRASGV